jgi:hypothetical protein
MKRIRRHYAGKRLLSREDLEPYAGMLMVDIAAELKCSRDSVYSAAHRHGIRHLFPRKGGEASWVARRGYAI